MRLALALLAVAPLLPAQKPNAVLVLRNSQVAPAALRAFEAKYGDVFTCTISNENLSVERLRQAKVLFLEHPSPAFLARLKAPALAAIRGGLRVATDVPDTVQRGWGIEPPLPLLRRLLPYWQNGGEDNLLNFFTALYVESGGPAQLAIAPPREAPKLGVYHPDAPRTFNNLTEYLAWYRTAKPNLGPLAVVTFFSTYLKNRDTGAVDALVGALEKQGLAAAGVFGWPHHTTEPAFAAPADDPPRILLSSTLSLSKPEDAPFLEKQNLHVISWIVTRDSYAVWSETDRGIPADRVATSLSEPERNGATDPILVATTETGPDGAIAITVPITERVEMAARRARRWLTLAEKPNAQKRLAILYYNNPPGKGNLGASYLNLAPSLEQVLTRLRAEGYDTGQRLPTADEILGQLERAGRNVETWAPGELRKMIEAGGTTLVPVELYEKWFAELPARFRQSINARWGQPRDAKLMAWVSPEEKKFFVVPGMFLGNVFLGPQILRASFAEYTNLQHSATLPPHHGYVAAYLYYRHFFKADAVIHMGRHGTLEWLPGKNAGQAGWDASEVILGDLPNVNYYIMDGDGEALQARRRSAAVDLSHLTPMLAHAGKEDRFTTLSKALGEWEQTHETAPALAAEYAATAWRELESTGLAAQLKLATLPRDEALERAAEFLESIEEAPIPLGLPTLGISPSEDRQREGFRAMLLSSFPLEDSRRHREQILAWADQTFAGETVDPDCTGAFHDKALRVLADGRLWLSRLRASAARELDMLPRILRAEFLPSGLVGDPIAVPDALPSGRNLHQGDPSRLPTPAAWELGRKLGDQLIAEHTKKNGKPPERISMVLWQGETGRNQGAMEAEALYLMGVRPEWNARGQVDRLSLIPEAELGRPRVNVLFTASGLYRDGLGDKIILLDRAARLAAAAGDNALSRQNKATERALLASGMAPEQAAELAGARVFASAPGSYGFGLNKFVEQSRDKEEPQTMAQLYLTKMNYAFTEKSWGANAPKLLEHQLRGNEVILHSRSSNLYGAADNDDVYQYMGGLRVASEAAGAKPELLINNFRRRGSERMETARNFLATELNARNWNPKWLKEMQKEGYSGAREMVKAVEYLYGWQATAAETIDPSVWKKTYDVYVADEYKLGLKEFFDRANPAAKQNLVARLLEVDQQGTYKFSDDERAALVKEYVQLVSQNGPACSANVCGNARLQKQVMSLAKNLAPDAAAKFEQEFANAANARPVPRKPATPAAPPEPADPYRGLKISMVKLKNFAAETQRIIGNNPRQSAGVGLALLLCSTVIAWTKRRRPFVLSNLDLSNS
jgi:cobaltochelatase CobN